MAVVKHIFVYLVSAILLMPTVASFSHVFSGHGHELCKNYADEHFHAKSLECELYSFHPTPALAVGFFSYEILLQNEVKSSFHNLYQFLVDYQKLPFELRGPPMAA